MKALTAQKKRKERQDKASAAALEKKKAVTNDVSDIESQSEPEIVVSPAKRGRKTNKERGIPSKSPAKMVAKTKMTKLKATPTKASTPRRKDPKPIDEQEEEEEDDDEEEEDEGAPPGGYFSSSLSLTELCRLWESIPHLYDAADPLHRDPAARRQAESWIADQLNIPGKLLPNPTPYTHIPLYFYLIKGTGDIFFLMIYF